MNRLEAVVGGNKDNVVPFASSSYQDSGEIRELLTIMFTDLVDSTKLQSDYGDAEAAREHLRSLQYSNGKVGVIGTCSGGRHTFLVACRTTGFDAAVDCWGGSVIMAPDRITPQQPVSPFDYTKDLSCPLLGIFGNDDQSPPPDQVDRHEEELKKHGKEYEFHRYDGAGHGFFYYHRPSYRQEQAMDGWDKIFDFFGRHLKG